MSGRPEALWPLFSALSSLDGVGPKTASALEGLGIQAPRDALFHLPHAVIDRTRRASVLDYTLPTVVTVEGTIGRHIPAKRKGAPSRITVEDARTSFQIVNFHARASYLESQYPTGQRRVISGKAELFDGIAQIVHPDYVLRPDEAHTLPEAEPVYSLVAGVTQRTMGKVMRGALARVPDLPEWIDPHLKAERDWPTWKDAVRHAHAPGGLDDTMESAPARARLAYDELFAHQMTLALARARSRRAKGRETVGTRDLTDRVLAALPFAMTNAQTRALSEIAGDMASPRRMNRLLQGDVGSGKTAVALMALLIAVEAGGQGVLMAPTEILARQHFEGLEELARQAGVQLDVLTGRDKGAGRRRKLEDIAQGRTGIVVGTHALFQRDVEFCDLRLAIVDEQHRFGVRQRLEMGRKGPQTDVLVMTATPIPRSLALTQYGDMDVSVLDEKPPGRQPIKTAMISLDRMQEVVDKLRAAIADGRQAYWVCPLVDESELVDLTAAEARFAHLRAALGEGVVGLVHGQLSPQDKDAAMARFVAGETSVLVATTVIEVGVNVPSATIMVIERAEAFGLAQLHQLRGRVGRGSDASTCLLLYQAPLGETGRKRLETLRRTEDGFVISQVDLEMRGAGDVIGTAQSGLPRFQIADLERQSDLMQVAQSDARALLAQDPDLSSPRGQAARSLLWLMRQDEAIRLMTVG